MDEFITSPLTVVIDSNEGAPFPFASFTEKVTRQRAGVRETHTLPLVIRTERQALWSLNRRDVQIKSETHSVGFADYTIRGHETEFAIERKSIPDLFGTLSARRGRFEAEVKRLHEDCKFAAIVVEGGWQDIVLYRETGMAPSSVTGTITAWMIRYPKVQWILAPGRAGAERIAFRLMEKFWKEVQQEKT